MALERRHEASAGARAVMRFVGSEPCRQRPIPVALESRITRVILSTDAPAAANRPPCSEGSFLAGMPPTQREDARRNAPRERLPEPTKGGAMTDSEMDELGPVDYVVVEFPADRANFSGEMAAELSALTKSGQVRVLDLLFLKKNPDGSIEGFESHDFGDDELGELRELETELAMLLAEEDVEAIGAALEPESVAAVLVWENVWAAPFGSAVRRSGGELVASGRIPIQALAAALEADEHAKEGV